MKKLLVLLMMALFLIACSYKKSDKINQDWIKDTNSFDILIGQFAHNVENIWGVHEILMAGPKDYVKYIDQYRTRSHINFLSGAVFLETITSDNPGLHLRQAIIRTLLMGDNPISIDLYSDVNKIQFNQEPFLYGQVLDNKGLPIRREWQAAHFADELLKTKLQKRVSGAHVIYTIRVQLVSNHLKQRANKYLPIVQKASKRYGIELSLILAIMQIESSFNPYAISGSNALGLMQIVQHTAGKDVFQMQGKWGKPSRRYLFNPKNNIDTGTAYLALLKNNYLGGIQNSASHRYAVITAYNSGAGSVLRLFSNDKNRAVSVINGMQPEEVYQMLTTKHPIAESRDYLVKVNNAQQRYWHS
ncbi:membrane-bound lytic murein transglycosylase MltC [Candidatus Gillettellia adelgis]